MKFCILASGSRGNSIYIEDHDARILVDVGLSARNIEQRLSTHDLDPHSIDAIVLTHAHRDHTQGVGVFANRYQIPIWAHSEVLRSIDRFLKFGQATNAWRDSFDIKHIRFTPFRVPHDSDPTVGYVIQTGSRKLAICTDLGIATDEVRQHINDVDALILESNHDREMLMKGNYPFDLKERITGRRGHLSNHEAGELLREVAGSRLKQVVLGHLSLHNNTPDLALKTVLDYLGADTSCQVDVIEQRMVSQIYSIR